jgi:hypothetical protein
MLDALHWRDVPLDTQFDIGCGYMDHPDDETSYQDMVRLFPGRHYFGIVIDPTSTTNSTNSKGRSNVSGRIPKWLLDC